MRILKYLLSLLPTKLPVGMQEFRDFADSIIELSGEYADRDSMTFAIATMILHLGPQKSSVPKNYFVRSLRKTAANQVAGAFFTEIKEKQQAAQKAQQVADTASPDSTPNGNVAETKEV